MIAFVALSVTAGFCEEFLFEAPFGGSFLRGAAVWKWRWRCKPWSLGSVTYIKDGKALDDHSLRRAIRHTGGDAKESAAGNDPTHDAG